MKTKFIQCPMGNRLAQITGVILFFFLNFSLIAQTKYGGVDFPQGDISFADQVVSFNPGNGSGEKDGSAVIGVPDNDKQTGTSIIGGKGDVTLGSGGSITIRFSNNYLIDIEGMDLYVYEAGPATEPFKVEISTNGSNWIDLGTVQGQPTGLDIQSKVSPGDKFQYVRITATGTYSPRDPKDIGKALFVGSDIDAIGAIGSVFRPDVITDVVVTGGVKADKVCLTGDKDNLNFGWPKGFNVFSGKSTPVHTFPWNINPTDGAGMDRIIVGSSAKNVLEGYSRSTKRPANSPQEISVNCDFSDVTIRSAAIQIFVDDFQPARLGSKFQVLLNGRRAPFIENAINALDQTGPIGKLLTLQVPNGFLPDIASEDFTIFIDDPTSGKGDGFAIDFVQILINPSQYTYTGTITGIVKDSKTNNPIANAMVSAGGIVKVMTDGSGRYILNNVPAGMASVNVTSPNNGSANKAIDLPANTTKTLDFTLDGAIIIIDDKDCNGQGIYMYAEDRKGKKGTVVEMPVFICNVDDLANMDIDLNWNSSIAELQNVKKGSSTKSHMLQWNEVSKGKLKVAFASSKGFNGSGSVAVLVYKLIGQEGSSTEVNGRISTANMSNGTDIPISGFSPGLLTISEPTVIGDCDGDDKLTERDALAALQIAVQKRPFDKCYDVNKDGKVDSQDARIIMRRIVGLPAA